MAAEIWRDGTAGWILPGLNRQNGVSNMVVPLVIPCCCDAEQSAAPWGKRQRSRLWLRDQCPQPRPRLPPGRTGATAPTGGGECQKPCCNWCATAGALRAGTGWGHPTSQGCPSLPGQRHWCDGHAASRRAQPAAHDWISLDPIKAAGRCALHDGSAGHRDEPAGSKPELSF